MDEKKRKKKAKYYGYYYKTPPKGKGKKRKSNNGKRPNRGKNEYRQPPKKQSSFDFVSILLILGIIAFVYVVFLMPSNSGTGLIGGNNNSNVGNNTEVQDTVAEFNLYHYINKLTAGRGKIEYDFTFTLNDGNVLKVKSEQNFNTKGQDTSIVGSTTYDWNGNAAVIDDFAYLSGGMRYEKTKTGYVKAENKNALDGGNLNIGKITDKLVKEEGTVTENGVECYLYTGVIKYSDLSTTMRNYVRAEGINIADINNLQLSIELFATTNNLPYKLVITFEDAGCMVKSNNLKQKNGKLAGTFTITMIGFNGTDPIDIPSETESATEGSYIFTDKITRFLNGIGVTK